MDFSNNINYNSRDEYNCLIQKKRVRSTSISNKSLLSISSINKEIFESLDIESSNNDIQKSLVNIALPIVFGFVQYLILSTFIFYCVSNRNIEITEGKSILFIYYYTISISLLWSLSIGYEIKGSNLFGKLNDIKNNVNLSDNIKLMKSNVILRKINKLTASVFVIYFYTNILLIIFSIFIAPIIVRKLPFSTQATSNFSTEIILLSFTFPQLSLLTIIMKIVNLLQNNSILNFSNFVSTIVHIIVSYIILRQLRIDAYGMGISYFCTYTVNSIILLINYQYSNNYGIDLFKILKSTNFLSIFKLKNKNKSNKVNKTNEESFNYSNSEYSLDVDIYGFELNAKYIFNNLKFSFYPAINMLIIIISSECNTYTSILISNLDFTVMSVYFNLFGLLSQFFEALSNSMIVLISYFIGKYNEKMIWRIFYQTIKIALIVNVFLVFFLYLNCNFIFYYFYSNQITFVKIANSGSLIFTFILFFANLNFPLSEFIIVTGYKRFAVYNSIFIRLGLQLFVNFILVYFFNYGLTSIMRIWLLTQISTMLVLLTKIFIIKKNKINLKLANIDHN